MIGVVNVTLVNPFSSKMYEIYENLNFRFKVRDMNTVLFSDKGLWTRESLENGNIMVIQAKALFKNQTSKNTNNLLLQEVSVMELDPSSRITKSTEAFVAILNDKHELTLKDVQIFELGKNVQQAGSITYHTQLTPNRIKETFANPEAISFWNLPGTIDFYRRSGFTVVKHHMHYLSLIASPFLLMAMVLVAAIFALRPNNRRGGVLYLIISGIITGFVVYFMSQVIYAFGLSGYLPEIMAVWAPTLITASLSITILIQQEEG